MGQAAAKSGFINNLGKIYAGYAGGFIFFVLVLAVLEQMGVSNRIIAYCFVFLTIGVYAYIGILSRTMELSSTTWPDAWCRRSSTAWRPAPTG